MKPVGHSLDDLRAAVDPFYPGDSPAIVFPWRPEPGARRYLFTAAQNATPVHPEWWKVLRVIARETGAALRVIPFRYKNPTSAWKGSQENRADWAREFEGLLVSQRATLNENLTVLADIKIQPTNSDPVGLGDLNAVSGASSAIVGHPKIQTRSIATPQNRMAKLLMTSGACTQENYSDTRAGRVAQFHHSLSAVLVELDGKKFYARRIHFDTKTNTATDSAIGVRYTMRGARKAPRPAALGTGDLHWDFADPAAVAATDDMIATTLPRVIVWHDAEDGYSVNHHHGRNPFIRIAKHKSGKNDVRAELDRLVEFYRARQYPGDTYHALAASNHTDDHMARWLRETDWRDDPVNASFYLRLAADVADATRMGPGGVEYPSPFKMLMDRAGLKNVRVLNRDETLMCAGVAMDMHGDKGPNGARGSIRNLRRIGVKSVIGHGHSPGEDEGSTQVGTLSQLRREYNDGPSSWLHANAFVGDDGKRQLVPIIDGEYRLRD